MKQKKTVTRKEVIETYTCDHCGLDCTEEHYTCSICGRNLHYLCFDIPQDAEKRKELSEHISRHPCRYCIQLADEFAPDMIELFELAHEAYNAAFAVDERWGKASRRLTK